MRQPILFSFSLAILFLHLTGVALAQSKAPGTRSEWKKMNRIDLKVGKKKVYNNALFYSISPDSLTIFGRVKRDDYDQVPDLFAKKTLPISAFDYASVVDKKKQRKYAILGGIGLGLLTYGVTKKLIFNKSNIPYALPKIKPEASAGRFEPYVLGGIGVALGISVGNFLGEQSVYFNKDKNAWKKLKRFSYK